MMPYLIGALFGAAFIGAIYSLVASVRGQVARFHEIVGEVEV